MRRAAVLLATLLLLGPAAAQGTLMDRLKELKFQEITITAAGDQITVSGRGSLVEGGRASELRGCMDKDPDCVEPLQSLSRGNNDGEVSRKEVESFETSLRGAMNVGGGEVQEVRDLVRRIAQMDGADAAEVRMERIRFRDADAVVGSDAPIHLDADATLTFDTSDKGRHRVSMARTETALEISQRFVIAPADGWHIVKDSIQPADLQKLHDGQRMVGLQSQFEGAEPLVFTIEKDTNWTFWIVLGLLALATGGVLAYLLWRRRRDKATPAAPAPAPAKA